MPKSVLRWPLQLRSNGQLDGDTSHQSGMRLFACTPKRTRIGIPLGGFNASLLEQCNTNLDEERALILTSILIDVSTFLPNISILEIGSKKDKLEKRKLLIDIKYLANDSVAKGYSFVWEYEQP